MPASKEQQEKLHSALLKFYKPKNLHRIIPIIEGKHKISLRLIDWFVTNYAKKYNVEIPQSNKEYFNVFHEYHAQLCGYSKQFFDPFRRRTRIHLPYKEPETGTEKLLTTTLGQLAFFRWAIENNILVYLENPQNYKAVSEDMIAEHKKSQKKTVAATRVVALKGTATKNKRTGNGMRMFVGSARMTFE